MKVLLISLYELGRQPFGVASAAAWLQRAGHDAACADLAIEALDEDAVRRAELIAFYLPMHTATRLAGGMIPKVKRINPAARLCCFGLYAPLNERYLRSLGVENIIGGEFEAALAALPDRGSTIVPLDKLQFIPPDRSSLPALSSYAQLQVNATAKVAGYTEATRGCKHLCRHCPIVPVYNGAFRVVQQDVVLEDIRRQVAAGAQHITFGDPDFFNAPTHARRIVEAFHREFPTLTFDATIKIEHLLRQRDLLPVLKESGCLFVTSAVESIDDAVLEKLDKRHTRADFIEAVGLLRSAGLTLAPTFIAFTPWTTRESYRELLSLIAELDLVPNVAPVQLALRLLITAGSRLLELEDIQRVIEGYDEQALVYRWRHPDAAMDRMAAQALRIAGKKIERADAFLALWRLATDDPPPFENIGLLPRAAIPYMNEPWYC